MILINENRFEPRIEIENRIIYRSVSDVDFTRSIIKDAEIDLKKILRIIIELKFSMP